MSAYRRLLALAERELELVLAGRFAETAEPAREREAIAASLPAVAPPEAASTLAELERTVRSTIAATLAAMDAARRELARIGEGRNALRSYAPRSNARALERRG